VRLKHYGIPKLLPFLKPYRKRIIVMIVMGVMASMIDALYPLFSQYALNHYVAEQTLDTLGWFILVYIVILVAQVLLNFWSVWEAGRMEMTVDRDLRNASFNHLQELSFGYFNQNNVGYIHARVMSDTGKIGELVSWRMMDIVWNGAYPLCAAQHVQTQCDTDAVCHPAGAGGCSDHYPVPEEADWL
jgi:ATP-binding cassette subfamily B protein